VRLSARATDPDGDALTYRWTASAGTFVENTGPSVVWRQPAEAVSVEIVCTVSDGYENVPLSLPVRVR
jgi:hypothetical protein